MPQSINVYVTMLALLLISMVVVINLIGAQATVYHDRVIHVHKKGNDSESCLMGQEMRQGKRDQYCKTLKFVASKLLNGRSRNITIILESQIKIRSTVNFSNHENLTIQGRSKDTQLSCKCNKTKTNGVGISFIRISYLKIYNFTIMDCCGISTSSLFIQDCSDIIVKGSQIRNNRYCNSGLMLINPSGMIMIRRSKFSENGGKSDDISQTGAGLHIEFSQYSLATVTIIEISDCDFTKNKSPGHKKNKLNSTSSSIPLDVTKDRTWRRQSIGGGMAIILLRGTNGTRINVANCTFVNNSATWGRGVCIYVQNGTYNNSISISNSTFVQNTAYWGGGGLQIRLGKLNKNCQNHISLENITFTKNSAGIFGGGTSVIALLLSYIPKPGEIVEFVNCTWYENRAKYSPAIDLSPYRFQQSMQGYSPIPSFKNVSVVRNKVIKKEDSSPHNIIVQGLFVITRFTAYFQGNIHFVDNWYTALYLTSGRAVFTKCKVHFYGNKGIKGGAIALRSFSALVINDHSHFTFINNSATSVGGGIYYAAIDQREYFSGQTCFLEYGGRENIVCRRNITFTFDGNTAPLGGTSIYSETIYSCYYAYFQDNGATVQNLTKFFDLIGDFQFDKLSNSTALATPLATGASKVSFNATPPLMTLPGESLYLPLVMHDEFEIIVHSEIGLRVEDNEQVRLENHFIVNNRTRVFGAPNQNITIVLSTLQQLCNIDYSVNITLLPCPPGFFYEEQYRRCWCSADSKSHSYRGITKCNYVHFHAYIKNGYWIGYYPSHARSESSLYTAFYPSIFNGSNTSGLLEITANSEHLSDFMCGNMQEGVLCGTCKKGNSAYYRSNGITCGANKLCRYGILFYILSDLTPTVIFFTIVMISGLSFSSGTLNGFVFFSQVVDVFSQDLIFSQNYNKGKLLTILQAGPQLIFGIFNFDFFSIFPFCLWEGATILDALAFKYITTLFALILVTLIVIIINSSLTNILSPCCLRMSRWKAKAFRWRKDSSVTHGISTFLIICYGQYTRVSFFILTRTHLQGMHGVEPISVTYYGGLPYFGKAHLFYAIPAIVCTTLLVVLPPLFLLLYPLIPHLLSLCGLNEHPIVNKALQLLCINRLLPLFDSFQSCYKDKMCFYAGLYFLYRVAAFLAYMHSETLPPVFLVILILGIHSVLQPYKSWKYNTIDGLIFLNIAIINSITEMIKYSLTTEGSKNILQLKLIQLAFIYLPILSLLLIIILLVRMGRKIKMVCQVESRREPPEPSNISVNRSRDADRPEIALQPMDQLQAPLLKVGFQYTV